MQSKETDVKVKIDSELLNIIQSVANEQGISSEQCIAEIVRQYLENNPPQCKSRRDPNTYAL